MATPPLKTLSSKSAVEWIPLSYSFALMFRKKQLLAWSLMLFCMTILFTWLGFKLTVGYMDDFTRSFLNAAPDTASILGWIKYIFWLIGKWLVLIISRVVAFYISFLMAYCLTSPGYIFLSTAAEKLHLGELFNPEDAFSIQGIITDLLEGLKIGLYGILVTLVALMVNFIPIIGQALILLLYTYYSALMFIDYPASRRRWSLGQKISWISNHHRVAFRLGFLPALVSMIPFLNIFLMSFLFPVMTIHTTLNFSALVSTSSPEKLIEQ
ncbi:MAG: EI24 domain-containing protein [Desulfoprunum sp.]|nr:EI24 domain-containing protein [Desulfoprunum sp.]